ncbi:beta-glucosidase 12-like [Pyrus ussuriensis x Pyrus communis]|uniref:Beta-glucosidase 12-like n=1 Tax=Pyrus ussuriensis x Pyrus communis TaxID=2448454 RepID=A0A5N5FW36_9ROSA|nr:beta-glucosidase 12-like [Pyrus ussuriensis x Pyrus communis]
MKNMGLDAYRLSISWSRVLPNGKLSGGVNQEGIKYYNNLINALLSRGLKPFVTIFHWDLPQVLEEEYRGFLSPKIVNHFRDFAEICYKAFGDRVKHWMTLNEPWTYAVNAYAEGAFAPGRWMALGVHWFVPVSNSTRHQNAALRSLDFMLGWFIEPLTSGSYPHTMKVLVGKRLPVFTAEQSKLIKGSYDFIGINYYTTHYSTQLSSNIELQGASSWLYVYPKGLQELLVYTKKNYQNSLIYITENGIDKWNDPTVSLEKSLNDTHRIDYIYQHLDYLNRAIK